MSVEHFCTTDQTWLSSFISRGQSKPQTEGNIRHLAKCLNPEGIWKSAAVYPRVSFPLCLLFAPLLRWKNFRRVIRNISATHLSFWNGSVLKGDSRYLPHFRSGLSIGFARGMQGYLCSPSQLVPHSSALCHPVFPSLSLIFPGSSPFSAGFKDTWKFTIACVTQPVSV